MTKPEPFRARRLSASKYHLEWPKMPGEIRLAVAASPHGTLNNELVLEIILDASPGMADLDLPATEGTLFFHLRTPTGEEHMITDRAIPARGVRNFRDFGGYYTDRGQRVRWRTLYRSGHLGSLRDEDRQLIARLGITLVCDFRTQDEMEMNPTRFDDQHQPRVEQLYLDPGDNRELVELMHNSRDIKVLQKAAREKMLTINRLLATAKTGVYRDMFRLLLENDGPSLIHCSAGKDRTGFGAAIILSALGVPEETIFHDYLLTNQFADARESAAWYSEFTGVKIDSEAVAPMFLVHSDYLRSAFDAIEETYGDIDTYLQAEMGLDNPALQELRQRYLEN